MGVGVDLRCFLEDLRDLEERLGEVPAWVAGRGVRWSVLMLGCDTGLNTGLDWTVSMVVMRG